MSYQHNRPAGYQRDTGVTFGRGAARELAAQAVRLQRTRVGDKPDRFRDNQPPRAWLKGIVTTAIKAASGMTPGKGAASVYYWDGAKMQADADLVDEPILNWYETYTPGAGIKVNLYWEGGALWLGPGDGDCSS